jgi:curli production assembly/transport component CsgG
MKNWILFAVVLFLSGCGSTANRSMEIYKEAGPPTVQISPINERLRSVPELDGKKITVAVYQFTDKTGQRKPSDTMSNLSSAVTQGAEVWVIKALCDVGNATWFEVVERVGMDNLIKERQLIRQTREVYEKELPNGPTPLKPMRFAGLIIEGGIVGYDSNVAIGGAGARYLGIGAQTEYRVDNVTIVMRIVSVSTGKVLMSVATQKTIASSREGADIFKFLDMGTKLLETETGYSVNEPVNYAVRAAIEQGVIELIYEGVKKDMWKFKTPPKKEKIKPVVRLPEVKKKNSAPTGEVKIIKSGREDGPGLPTITYSAKSIKYTGTMPKPRPLKEVDALAKWPNHDLNCDKTTGRCLPGKKIKINHIPHP